MSDKEQIRSLVIAALHSVIQRRPDARQFVPDGETLVYGNGGALDSLELVNLVIELEQQLDEQCGAVVTLADERAVSQKQSPFRNIPALVDLVASRLDEIRRG